MEKKKPDSQEPGYTQALNELKEIARKLDSEAMDLDQIEILLNRAEQLSRFCRESLRRVSDRLSDFQQSQFPE
jgi:exodeoxyribonuclease VII small subunit